MLSNDCNGSPQSTGRRTRMGRGGVEFKSIVFEVIGRQLGLFLSIYINRGSRKKKFNDRDLGEVVGCDEGQRFSIFLVLPPSNYADSLFSNSRRPKCDEGGKRGDVGRTGAACEEGGRRIARFFLKKKSETLKPGHLITVANGLPPFPSGSELLDRSEGIYAII